MMAFYQDLKHILFFLLTDFTHLWTEGLISQWQKTRQISMQRFYLFIQNCKTALWFTWN